MFMVHARWNVHVTTQIQKSTARLQYTQSKSKIYADLGQKKKRLDDAWRPVQRHLGL